MDRRSVLALLAAAPVARAFQLPDLADITPFRRHVRVRMYYDESQDRNWWQYDLVLERGMFREQRALQVRSWERDDAKAVEAFRKAMRYDEVPVEYFDPGEEFLTMQ